MSLVSNGNFGYLSCSRAMGKGMAIPGIRLVQERSEIGKP
jgi:hypothetical protein